MKQITFGSLFAGIGGMDLGFERAGMKCKWQVEIDDYATRVLEKHWPDVYRWRDVRTFAMDTDANGQRCEERSERDGKSQQSEIESSCGCDACGLRVDVIAAGFPCQDISYAGSGAGLDGERSGLFFEAVRVVRQLRPRYVVLENVAALLTRGLDRVHGELAEIGYCSESHCIPAAAVGAPHIRDRVFILAYARHGGIAQWTWGPRSLLESEVPSRQESCSDGEVQPLSDTLRSVSEPGPGRRGVWEGNTSERGGGGWWATEPDVGRVANGVPKRVDRLRGLGNAVVPQVAEWIGRRIVEGMTHESSNTSQRGT